MEQHKINYRKYFAFYLSGDGSRMRVDDFNRDDGTRVCKGGAYTWSNWKFNNLFQVIAYNWRYGTLCFIAIRASLWLGADLGLAVPLRCGVCLHATACRCVIYNLFLPLRPCTFFMIKAIVFSTEIVRRKKNVVRLRLKTPAVLLVKPWSLTV